MQILEIVLYSNRGQKRTVKLKSGAVNIITGGSATGKSALIEIVNFCLGASQSAIPEGPILETVAWFGVLLDFTSSQIFVARPNPQDGGIKNRVYFIEADKVSSPAMPPTEANTTTEAISDHLSRRLGIAPNRTLPQAGQTRHAFAADIKHALLYCFQQQGEIAQKIVLFHRQAEPFLPQAIKDTLPYFLGAIREDHLALEQELNQAKRELRQLQLEMRENELIQGESVSKAASLVAEAMQVGLVAQSDITSDLEVLRAKLREAIDWTPVKVAFHGSDILDRLQEELRGIERSLVENSDRMRAARAFAHEAEGYSSEVKRQEFRLESIGLYTPEHDDPNKCPVCMNNLSVPVPMAKAINQSLAQLRHSLDSTAQEQPRLREYIDDLAKERESHKLKAEEKKAAIDAILREEKTARTTVDLNVRRSKIVGRISLWLESVREIHEGSTLSDRIEKAQKLVGKLEVLVDQAEIEDRLESILSRIGLQMTKWAVQLNLEHSSSPVRLDLKHVTVVVDRGDRPIDLQRMGSGANWVGYHLIVHLALHEHFRNLSRPVPRFLFLDQPTQVYYPSDRDAGSLKSLKDEDREAVQKMFGLIFEVVKNMTPDFQVIITDHADLVDSEFQKSVVQRWRNDSPLAPGETALIPKDWIQKSGKK